MEKSWNLWIFVIFCWKNNGIVTTIGNPKGHEILKLEQKEKKSWNLKKRYLYSFESVPVVIHSFSNIQQHVSRLKDHGVL